MSAGHTSRASHGPVFGGPSTPLGHWSLRLEGVFVLLLVLFYGGALTGQSGGGPGTGFFSNLHQALTILGAGVAAACTGVIAAIAITLRRERSILVYCVACAGLLVVFFAAGEAGG